MARLTRCTADGQPAPLAPVLSPALPHPLDGPEPVRAVGRLHPPRHIRPARDPRARLDPAQGRQDAQTARGAEIGKRHVVEW